MKQNENKKLVIGMIIVLVLIAIAGGIFWRLLHENKQLSQTAAISSETSVESPRSAESIAVSAASSISTVNESDSTSESESVVSVPSLTLPEETGTGEGSEELKQVADAALPNVSGYADAVQNAGAGSVQVAPNVITDRSRNGKIVCIDAGHQDHGMSEKEPNAPGSSTMKAKLTTGTSGSASGKDEYEVNLEVSLQLRDELEKRGYTVVMTRETNNVNISNVERAQIANEANADIFIRIHCNSLDSSSVHGALTYQPSSSNPYLSSEVIAGSQRLARLLLDYQIQATGQRNAGIIDGDDMTGINWAQMPVTIVEMGFMSNPEEDLYISGASGQAQIVQGLANGVDAYFAS